MYQNIHEQKIVLTKSYSQTFLTWIETSSLHLTQECLVDVVSVSRFVSNWNCVNLVPIPEDHYQGVGTGSKHSPIKEIIMPSTWFPWLSCAMRFASGFSLSFSLTFRNNYRRAAYFFLMHRVISQTASTMHTKYKIFVAIIFMLLTLNSM